MGLSDGDMAFIPPRKRETRRTIDEDSVAVSEGQDLRSAPGVGKPKAVVTICGSSRFTTAHELVRMHLGLMGVVVLDCSLYGHADNPPGAQHLTSDGDESTEAKQSLDMLHLQKIEMSDAVYVLNVGGYVGNSTSREINYALALGKRIIWLFPDAVPEGLRHTVQTPTTAAQHPVETLAELNVPLTPHLATLLRANKVYENRNASYKDVWRKYGMKGSMVQLRNCVERMWTLVFSGSDLADKPSADNLLDAINYAAIAVRCHEEGIVGTWDWGDD